MELYNGPWWALSEGDETLAKSRQTNEDVRGSRTLSPLEQEVCRVTERGSHRCWRRVGCHSAYAGLGEHLNLSPNPIASRGTKADGQGG